jgi:hypothetical protein
MTRRTFRGYRAPGPTVVAGWCDAGDVLEALTGFGLAASAGLNAYIPLLSVGLLARYTDLITLPGDWQWLTNGWLLAVLAVLLALEIVADKIPTVDHVNDIVQTVVRPTSGGLAFGAISGAHTVSVSDPTTFTRVSPWVPVAAGILVALLVHALKATARLVINAVTFGIGGPVVSTIEDAFSLMVALAAILVPLLVIVLMGALVWLAIRKVRSIKDRRGRERPRLVR